MAIQGAVVFETPSKGGLRGVDWRLDAGRSVVYLAFAPSAKGERPDSARHTFALRGEAAAQVIGERLVVDALRRAR